MDFFFWKIDYCNFILQCAFFIAEKNFCSIEVISVFFRLYAYIGTSYSLKKQLLSHRLTQVSPKAPACVRAVRAHALSLRNACTSSSVGIDTPAPARLTVSVETAVA